MAARAPAFTCEALRTLSPYVLWPFECPAEEEARFLRDLDSYWSKSKRGRTPATHITTACPIAPYRLWLEVHSWGGMEKVRPLGHVTFCPAACCDHTRGRLAHGKTARLRVSGLAVC